MRQYLSSLIGAVVLVGCAAGCRPAAKDGEAPPAEVADATASGSEGKAATAVDSVRAGAGSSVALTDGAPPPPVLRNAAVGPRGRANFGTWAKLARAQLARPTDFARLTAALKRKQALANGVEDTAMRAELEKRALAGDAEAALTLGLLLRYGETGTDRAEGERLIAAAAEAGNPRAMAELGRILLADETRAGGTAQAETWLRKAWAAGESEGAYLLASAQRLGLLEPQAGEDATAILLAAAEAGNEASRRLLTLARKTIEGLDVAQLDRWMTELAETGDVAAMTQVATLKREAGDPEAALAWLERAAAGGSSDAVLALAMLAGRGEAGAEARAAAIAHLRAQLAEPATASSRAQYALAKLLVLDGDRAPERQAEALALLRAAGKDRIYQAAIAAMLIEDGADARAAIGTVLKMDDAAAYVRYVELRRERGDTEYSGLADAMPKPLTTVRPLYPLELKAAGTTGAVTVRFLVGPDGAVGSCEVVRSDHPAFSAAALEAVQQWRFQPGIKDGQPVATPVQITLPFRLGK